MYTMDEREKEIINELIYSSLLNENARKAIRSLKASNESMKEKLDKTLMDSSIEFSTSQINIAVILNSKIGEKIYWAHPMWKMEEHTITSIKVEPYKYEKSHSSKHKKYDGKLMTHIYTDNCEDGFYLAVDLGETLFLNKNEAFEHSNKH